MSDNLGRSRITRKFAELHNRSEKALITYITAGYPDLDTTATLAIAMAEAGADIIELGIPFSDPVADGPVIQKAAQGALEGGTTVAGILGTVAKIRQCSSVPLVLMTYYNLVYQYGLARFTADLVRAGGDGIIVPDLPMEEANHLRILTKETGLDLIPLAAPNASDNRLKALGKQGGGFVYCISGTGVTGERKQINTDLKDFIGRVRQATELPIAVGFGISTPEQARDIAQYCDGIIIGSAIVKLITQLKGTPDLVLVIEEGVRKWKAGLIS